MQVLLNNVTGGMAWAEGYSLALSLLFFLPAIIAFLRGHPRRWAQAAGDGQAIANAKAFGVAASCWLVDQRRMRPTSS